MMREFRQVVFDPIGVKLRKGRADAPMKQAAPLRQDRVVRHLLGQRMLETVLGVGKSWLFVDEFTKLLVAQHPLQLVIRCVMRLQA